jgi:hypothetical protein
VELTAVAHERPVGERERRGGSRSSALVDGRSERGRGGSGAVVAPRSDSGHQATWSSPAHLPDTAATRGDGGAVTTVALGRRWIWRERGGESEREREE